MATTFVPNLNFGPNRDVQELTKSKHCDIPSRFIKDEDERPLFTPNTSLPSTIPVVDLSKLVKSSKDEFDLEMSKLAVSCEEWGLFQVINHEIDVELIETLDKVAMDFFMLPLEEKQKYQMQPGTAHGYGQAFVFSEDQKLDWCNMFGIGIAPPLLRKPQFWPTIVPNFCETVDEYSVGVKKLCENLLSFIAMTLDLKKETFEDMFGEAFQGMRMNYYPPCPRPDLVMGLSPHSDASALTVLQQNKGCPVGLHVLKDNIWLPVQPHPNALFIFIGDTLEVMTNGKYKSVEHRAVADGETDRLSIVTFYAPNPEIEVGPMQELVNENNPPKFKRYIQKEYRKHYMGNKLSGKKSLEYAKIVV